MREKPTREIAKDVGIYEGRLRNGNHHSELEDSRRSGVTSSEHAELRRELRVTKMEVEILKRTAGYFAGENLLTR